MAGSQSSPAPSAATPRPERTKSIPKTPVKALATAFPLSPLSSFNQHRTMRKRSSERCGSSDKEFSTASHTCAGCGMYELRKSSDQGTTNQMIAVTIAVNIAAHHPQVFIFCHISEHHSPFVIVCITRAQQSGRCASNHVSNRVEEPSPQILLRGMVGGSRLNDDPPGTRCSGCSFGTAGSNTIVSMCPVHSNTNNSCSGFLGYYFSIRFQKG